MSDNDKKVEAYQLDELDKTEEPGEDEPLKPNDTDVEAGGGDTTEMRDNEKAIMTGDGEKQDNEKDEKSSGTKFLDHKAKVVLAIGGGILLILIVLIVVILIILMSGGWEEDKTWRYMRLIPKPNGPSNLIKFRHGHLPFEGRLWPDLTDQIKGFLDGYNPDDVLRNRNVTDCFPGQYETLGPPENMVCFFDVRTIEPDCLKPDYGYSMGSPCIFIQFTNISDWKPEQYTTKDMETIEDLPSDLRFSMTRPNYIVYLECKGNTPIDQENMGLVEYTPTQGFLPQYFPYTGHPHYMPPFVALRFKKPVTGIAIGITCKLWAKNLNYTIDREPSAILPFNLLIE